MKFIVNLLGGLAFMYCMCLLQACGPDDEAPSAQGLVIKVTDISDNPIKGAKVIATSAADKKDGDTGADGSVSFPELAVDSYLISIQADGYKPQTSTARVSLGQATTTTIKMEALPMLEISPASIYFTNDKKTETVYFKNRSLDKIIHLTIVIPENDKWLNKNKTTFDIPANTPMEVTFSADSKGLGYVSLTSRVILTYTVGNAPESQYLVANLNLSNPEAPSVETSPATGVTQTTAQITGLISSIGGSQVTTRGICWSEGVDPQPGKDSQVTTGGGGIGSFTLTANNLKPGTTYYARAFATNGIATATGNAVKFTTATTATSPSLTLEAPINVTEVSAGFLGKLTSDGGSKIMQVGICYNTSGNPKYTDNPRTVSVDGSGNFNVNLTGLVKGATYYVKAFAINEALGNNGPGYSNEQSFTTKIPVATSEVATLLATNVTENTAVLQGNLTALGGSPIVQHGFCYSNINATPDVTDKARTIELGPLSVNKFEYKLSGLKKGTNYYYRAYVKSADNVVAYGVTKDVITPEQGLQVFYPFNGNSVDESGNGNNAVTTAKLTADKYGNVNRAYDLSAGPVIMQNKEYVGGFADNLTVSLKVKMGESNFIGANAFLLGKFTGCTPAYEDGYYFYTNAETQKLHFRVVKSGVVDDFPLFEKERLVDQWHMITFTKVGKICKFYLDGNPEVSQPASFERVRENSFPYDYSLNGATLNIGSFNACSKNTNFNGLIDEFRVYNLTMTDFAVRELVNR